MYLSADSVKRLKRAFGNKSICAMSIISYPEFVHKKTIFKYHPNWLIGFLKPCGYHKKTILQASSDWLIELVKPCGCIIINHFTSSICLGDDLFIAQGWRYDNLGLNSQQHINPLTGCAFSPP